MPQDRGQKLKQKDPEQLETAAQKRKKRRSRVWRVLVCILAVLAAGMSALAVHVYLSGKNLRKGAAAPNLEAFAPQTQTEEETDAPQDKQPPRLILQDDNSVLVGGTRYRFNDEVQTFLLLGIDSYTPEQSDGSCNVHAFSDVVMLAAMDFRSNRISLISLSRDTMCEFQRLNPDGTERDRAYGQLALAFSYGEGKEKSCEITKDAVSRIMSELPIRSCSALYLYGLRALNDAVGGVRVTILEDLDYKDPAMQKGVEVTLDGRMAERYIRARERTPQGNLNRMERQKQYVKALMKKAMEQIKKNPESILDIYNSIKNEVVTDLTTGEMLYLATAAANMTIAPEIRTVPGEVRMSADNYVQYDIDEAGLLELLLSVYYIECEE